MSDTSSSSSLAPMCQNPLMQGRAGRGGGGEQGRCGRGAREVWEGSKGDVGGEQGRYGRGEREMWEGRKGQHARVAEVLDAPSAQQGRKVGSK
eukprot:365076-Chlamydomonas_euryale.AAC.12